VVPTRTCTAESSAVVRKRSPTAGLLSASSPSKSDPSDNGSPAGAVHRVRWKADAVSVFERRWYPCRGKAASEAVAAYAARVERRGSLGEEAFKPVVLCRGPSNHGLEGSARERCSRVPSSLRSSAPPQPKRWARDSE
jgi:hypothetical protein